MKFFFTVLLLTTFWCSKINAAICIGETCKLIDYMAKSNGSSLDNILNEVQGNIIDPIIDSQSKMVAWNGGFLDFTPAGSNGNTIKLTLWSSGAWQEISTTGTIFNSTYISKYNTGIIRFSGSVEIPINYKNDVIVNLGAWNGESDYGLQIIDGKTNEFTIRFGLGNRFYLIKESWTSTYFINGMIIGSRKMSANFPGRELIIRSTYTNIVWNGEESYEENTSYLSLPIMFGTNLKFWNLTLSLDTSIAWIYQSGLIEINKKGPIGPVIGQNDFYQIGINSNIPIKNSYFWPIAKVGIEWNIFTDLSLSANWNPKIQKYPQQLSGGISWQF